MKKKNNGWEAQFFFTILLFNIVLNLNISLKSIFHVAFTLGIVLW